MEYAASPQKVDSSIYKLSTSFKMEVVRTMFAIVLFATVYVLVFACVCALSALCIYAGFAVISMASNIILMAAGVGIIGIGSLLLFFMLKFLFKTNANDLSSYVELTENDQPELFEFIQRLTLECGASRPKHIYLSPDVNASVFYNSSFLSMVLPVQKNLVIGAGIVNALNTSELKAVLAHEFGHFSQRSLMLGSYVYNVNYIIHNLLYDNESYGKLLDQIANIGGVFSLIAAIIINIVRSIQAILEAAHIPVEKSYMALSRQMEFHADAIAASVSGGNQLAAALHKLDLAAFTYHQTLESYWAQVTNNRRGTNFYTSHRCIMNRTAELHDVPLVEGLPDLKGQEHLFFERSRLKFEDQWASHPSITDRVEKLKSYGLETATNQTPAWCLFKNIEPLQKQFTEMAYKVVKFEGEVTELKPKEHQLIYDSEVTRTTLPKVFKGYYDNHNVTSTKGKDDLSASEPDATFEDLFSNLTAEQVRKLRAMESDVLALDHVRQYPQQYRSFEYMGLRKTGKDAFKLWQALKKEQEEMEAIVEKNDWSIYKYFSRKSEQQQVSESFHREYQKTLDLQKTAQTSLDQCQLIYNDLHPVFSGMPISHEYGQVIGGNIKTNEKPIKEDIKAFSENADYEDLLSVSERKLIEKFASTSENYFPYASINEPALEMLNKALGLYTYYETQKFRLQKRKLLDLMLKVENGGS